MFKGNMADILRQAQELGENLKEKQAELAQKTVQVSVGGDMVSMTFNGRSEALSIRIDPEIVDRNDVRMLEDLVLSAVNEGVRRSQEMMQEEMSKLAGGLKIPGITAWTFRRPWSGWCRSCPGCRVSGRKPPSGSPSVSCATTLPAHKRWQTPSRR